MLAMTVSFIEIFHIRRKRLYKSNLLNLDAVGRKDIESSEVKY